MADSSTDLVGGRYRVLGNLGKGAMGLVYMAHDPVLDRKVAIKQMTAEIADNQELRQRFYIEARAAARLNHPNIITIHELHESGGDIFMIMELLEGKSLAALIQAKSVPLSIEATLDVMAQVCDGLEYAHQRTIVHRDIKPANLFLTPSGVVKILDFGIARLGTLQMTAAGALIGTPDYMSPEQIRGDEIDRRTDLWAVGAVLYQLLSGTKPFEGKPLAKLLTAIAQSPHVPLRQRAPSVPGGVSDLVDRLLSKPRDGRPASAALVRDELRAILGRESASSTKATLTQDEYEETVFMAVPSKAQPPPPPPIPPMSRPSLPPATAVAPAPPPARPAAGAGDRVSEVEATVLMRADRPQPQPAPPPAPPVARPPTPPAVLTPAAAVIPPPVPAREAAPSPTPTPAGAPRSKGTPLWAAIAIVGVIGLGIAIGAGWWFLRGSSPAPAAGGSAPSAAAPAGQPAAAPAAVLESAPPVEPAPAATPTGRPSAAPAGQPAAVQPSAPPPESPAGLPAANVARTQPAAAAPATAAPPPPQPATAAPPAGRSAAPPAAARRGAEGGADTGVSPSAAARPGLSEDTLDAFKGRTSGGGSDSAATLAAVNRINYVLEQYVRALVNGDADAIREYRPSLSPEETALMRARQLKVRLDDVRVQVDGTDAVARCRRRIEGTAANGGRIQEDGPIAFSLVRKPTGWIITDVR
jgi:eukaryotic-like serine/threonine-protein kinase